MNVVAPTALQLATQRFVARHEGLSGRLPAAPARDEAVTALAAHGLPTPREESWHYTNLRPLADIAFSEPVLPVGDHASLAARLPTLDAPRLVFVDGRFHARLSDLPHGFAVRTGVPAFGPLARPATERIVALNTMLAEDGATIEVPPGVDGGTLVLASLGTDARERAVSFHPRHAIRLGHGARLTIVEVFSGSGTYLANPVIEASIGETAVLTHIRLQDESPRAFHLSTFYADVARGGTYDGFALCLGARLSRSELHVRLAGPSASVHMNAAQLLSGEQHGDITTVVAHDAPGCGSRQTVKSVLSGRARGVFQGKIEVARVAQKTDGYQMSQALLLSAEAEIDNKPQLEIYADDVKCSHGCTVGALDADQLFYLRSRGVPQDEARSILVRAFLDEALEPVSHEAGRALLEAAINGWWEKQA